MLSSKWSLTLFTDLAAIACAESTAETFLHQLVETVAQGFQFDLVNDLANKGKLQQKLCLMLINTPLLHVEFGGVVELSHRGAMRALYVVGINLQHRLSVHTGVLGHHEVLVALLGVGLLRVVTHQHSSGKGTNSLIVQHIFVELV